MLRLLWAISQTAFVFIYPILLWDIWKKASTVLETGSCFWLASILILCCLRQLNDAVKAWSKYVLEKAR